MYIGKQYTTTRTQGFKKDYRCKKCGFTSPVTVFGVGVGRGNSPYFLGNAQAELRSQEQASNESTQNADLTLKLCPCPQCGARDATGFTIRTILTLIASFLSMLALGGLLALLKGRPDAGIYWIFGIGALLTPGLVYYTNIHWKWTTARSRVFFEQPPKPAADPFEKNRFGR